MPLYCYECAEGHRFESFNSMSKRHNAICPLCKSSGRLLISKTNMRIAEPLVWLDASGKEIARKSDGGITPPVGQPYPIGG